MKKSIKTEAANVFIVSSDCQSYFAHKSGENSYGMQNMSMELASRFTTRNEAEAASKSPSISQYNPIVLEVEVTTTVLRAFKAK